MRIILRQPKPKQSKQITCGCCESSVSYTNKNIVTGENLRDYVVCPNCKFRILVGQGRLKQVANDKKGKGFDMAETTFTFKDNEHLDAKLCALRNDMLLMLCKVNKLYKEVLQGDTDVYRQLYLIGAVIDERGNVKEELSTVKPCCKAEPAKYVPTTFVANRLYEAMEGLADLLGEWQTC